MKNFNDIMLYNVHLPLLQSIERCVKLIDPEAFVVIAGGFVLDLLFDKHAKDIDIFICSNKFGNSPELLVNRVQTLCATVGLEFDSENGPGSEVHKNHHPADQARGFVFAANAKPFHGIVYNIIVYRDTKSISDLLQQFDLSSSMGAIDTTGYIHKEPNLIETLSTNVVKIMNKHRDTFLRLTHVVGKYDFNSPELDDYSNIWCEKLDDEIPF